jgi:hypothetical protein
MYIINNDENKLYSKKHKIRRKKMNKYYLLSLKHSKHQNQYTWWRANNSGYTIDIQQAGVYSEEDINNRKNYYSNTGVMPIPVKVVEELERKIVIPTIDKNYELLGVQEHLKTAKEY